MVKSKFIAIAAAAALAAMLGLSACGGQAASSSASSASAGSASASSSAAASSASASSSAASSIDAISAEELVVSWQGALADGTLVDYINSEDGTQGGLVLTPPNNAEPKRWLGALTATEGGRVTIVDDQTKETVNFSLTGVTEDGALTIEVEGYGKGAIVPMTAADWARVAEAEELAKTLGSEVNWVGALEDGSLIVYMDNDDSTEAVMAITPANGTEMKTWTGKVTKADDGKVTITDDTTKQAISFTSTKADEDGTVVVDVDGYGKGVLVQMTYADYLVLDELAK